MPIFEIIFKPLVILTGVPAENSKKLFQKAYNKETAIRRALFHWRQELPNKHLPEIFIVSCKEVKQTTDIEYYVR